LVLTNDGDLTQKLTHPVHHRPKLYYVRIKGAINDKDLKSLAKGVMLEDGPTQPAKVRLVSRNNSYSELELTLREGRNRQIRRMFAHLGYAIQQLVRLAIGRLQLGKVPPGSWRYLTALEVRQLTAEIETG
jgi:pseudouridine synthase